MEADHPFLVGMEYVFQSEFKIFFVMEFVRGGELYTHLRQARRFKEEQAKFYIATIASALGYLHNKKILYRDIKTKNILMGEDGYVTLTDFGLSKDISKCKTTSSICGTPSFMAPEIVKMDEYSYSIDWWALGVLTFLLIVGYNPFYNGGNMQKMFNCI